MLGILYILTAIITGFCFIGLLVPQVFEFGENSYMGRKIGVSAFFIVFPASLITGTLFMSWLTYIIAYALKNNSTPLAYANGSVFLIAFIFVAVSYITKPRRIIENMKKTVRGFNAVDGITFAVILVLACFLMIYTFNFKDGAYRVGASVYSDFATHLDMIRSFSNGNNFPTGYSHYAGADVKYHFMFQFLTGNLEYLGLRLDVAFNTVSILFFTTASMLLYLLAVKLFAKRTVGFLTLVFFWFRSSSSFFKYVAGAGNTLKEVIDTLRENRGFLGYTENENWGLYNLNVYVNQRHLCFGLTMLLLAIILLLPDCAKLIKRVYSAEKKGAELLKAMFVQKEGWLASGYRIPVYVGLIVGLTGFYNGACVIGCLLVLFFLAFIADHRFDYLITAVISLILVLIQTKFFIKGDSLGIRWDPGYLSHSKNIFTMSQFLISLLGVFFVLVFASTIILNGYYRYILLAFASPIIFAMTMQLTVDVSVNHKYIMIGCMLCDIFIAAFVFWLIKKKSACMKVLAGFLIVLMTATGIYEFRQLIVVNSEENNGYLLFPVDDPVTKWVMKNADAKDIILSDWYSLNNVTIAGGMLYYGWPYYAWSAGYDTYYRETQVKLMYEAKDSETLDGLIRKNNIRYIIVDFSARTSSNYYVNEDVIATTYERVFTYDENMWRVNIYDTHKPLN